jgi:NADH:ubiquinone oxidoreductase subunit 6 (subunit J)
LDFLSWLASNWLLVLPLLLGAIALWWLLPQPRRRDWRPAAGFGAAGLLIAALTLVDASGGIADMLFYVFAGLAVVAGFCMITQRNPVYAALWFALVILSTCGLFLLQSAPFLAAATIIVYAGAIIVTFLFVIMLAQQTGLAEYDRRSREPLLACLAGFVLLTGLLYVLQMSFVRPGSAAQESRLPEIRERLAVIQELLERQASRPEIEEAMYFQQQMPLGDLLREELKRRPTTRGQVAELDLVLTRLGEARRNDDREAIRRGIAEVFLLSDLALEAQQSSGMAGVVSVPASLRPRQAPLSADPSGSVAALGTSLFGDYLWAVELAGTLLLIATVGAIAIAQRRKGAVIP